MQSRLAVLYCASAALLSLQPAAAQQSTPGNPANPAAAVPPARYQSAFTGYQPLRDEKPAPWREVNEEVARAGGHLGIFRSNAPAAAGGHAGHHPGAAK